MRSPRSDPPAMHRRSIRPAPRTGLLTALLTLVVAGACGDDPIVADPSNPATGLTITPEEPALRLGATMALEATFTDDGGQAVPAPGPVQWTSSAPEVLSVDEDGVVRALRIGSATIEAARGDLSGSTTATVLAPLPDAGTNETATGTVSPAGDTLSATGADGVHYTLVVPPGALAEPVEISMTPVASIADFPVASGPSAGVLLEPAGLRFTMPAELVVVAPGPLAPASVGFSQGADAFRLVPALVHGDTARIAIAHFSSAGTAEPTAEEVSALGEGTSSSPEDRARQEVTEELHRASTEGTQPDQDAIEESLKQWFDEGVLPALEAAAAGSGDAEEAVGEWLRWWGNVQTWADGRLESEIEQARATAAEALGTAIDLLNQQCVAQNDLEPVREIFHLVGLAALTGLDELHDGLTRSAVASELCVQVVIEEATLADPFTDGSSLEVRAGLSIGGGAADYGTPLDVTLTSDAASLSPASGATDAEGRFTATVDLDGGETRADIDIEAVLPEFTALAATLTVTAEATLEIELLSSDDSLDPEDVAFVEALVRLGGAPQEGVTVEFTVAEGGGSVEPGSVVTGADGSGAAVYTAPEEPGTVLLVATASEGGQNVADSVEIVVRGKGQVVVQDAYIAWGIEARARDGGDPMRDGVDQWITTTGPLVGSYDAAASMGGAVSSGSVSHDSDVAENVDSLTLLLVLGQGESDGTVAAGGGAGATLAGGSDVHVTFVVQGAPVFYRVDAEGQVSGGTTGGVELTIGGAYVFEREWHGAPASLAEEGWLEPGTYSLDAAVSVLIGAGSNGDGPSASGSGWYTLSFVLYSEEPEEPAGPAPPLPAGPGGS